jgi:hypothetical protein
MIDSIFTGISFILTLMVFSYVLGDIPVMRNFYRVAVYIFVGMTAAFTLIVTYEGVLLPYIQEIQQPTSSTNTADTVIFITALLFGLLLILKPIRRLTWLTNSVFAVVIVVGASVAIIGAISGTLFPLVRTSTTIASTTTGLLSTGVIFLGTITSLLYFHYQTKIGDDGEIKQGGLIHGLGTIGKVFIVITLGAIYAATMLTSLTILTERIGFLLLFGG